MSQQTNVPAHFFNFHGDDERAVELEKLFIQAFPNKAFKRIYGNKFKVFDMENNKPISKATIYVTVLQNIVFLSKEKESFEEFCKCAQTKFNAGQIDPTFDDCQRYDYVSNLNQLHGTEVEITVLRMAIKAQLIDDEFYSDLDDSALVKLPQTLI